VYATRGTHEYLSSIGVNSIPVQKIHEGSPNIDDLIRSGEIDLVINTISPDRNPEREGARIRRASVEHNIPCLTSLDTARALLLALSGRRQHGDITAVPIHEYVAM
jgi:carbamoyl-phosphate synthase large subunit